MQRKTPRPDRIEPQNQTRREERPHYKHEDPEPRGNIDRGSDDDVEIKEKMRPVDDELADEPGIGP